MPNTFQLPFSYQNVGTPAPVDYYYGPWSSTTFALSVVTSPVRYTGQTICVISGGTAQEYWFQTGTTDNSLVLKTNGSSLDVSNFIKQGSNILTESFFIDSALDNSGDINIGVNSKPQYFQIYSNDIRFYAINSLGDLSSFMLNSGSFNLTINNGISVRSNINDLKLESNIGYVDIVSGLGIKLTNSFSTQYVNIDTSLITGSSYTQKVQAKNGVIALLSDITGSTSSGSTGIISNSYSATTGTVISGDTYQTAISKIDGNTYTKATIAPVNNPSLTATSNSVTWTIANPFNNSDIICSVQEISSGQVVDLGNPIITNSTITYTFYSTTNISAARFRAIIMGVYVSGINVTQYFIDGNGNIYVNENGDSYII